MKATAPAVLAAALFCFAPAAGNATEFHVAKTGSDANGGSKSAPFLTIQRAADVAQPGDTITVHNGIYRERINPPRGGTSPKKAIVYRVAPGEKVEIKGSEVVSNWTRVTNDTWKVTVPNSLFGRFNPFTNLIRGDWFSHKGRPHHTGAVYLDGDWLVETVTLEEVLAPVGTPPGWLGQTDGYLLNLAWLRVKSGEATRLPAASFAAQEGVQKAPCEEGGECLGFIENGDWVRYEGFNFGQNATELEFRTASATRGGIIEIRLDSPDGELLGTCSVPHTGGWQHWSSYDAKIKPASGRQTLCLVFRSKPATAPGQWGGYPLWFAKVDETRTIIWAQFKGVNPNEHLTEINARQTVFYPEKPNRNYITVRGFKMAHAATPWAPPTAEQIGLIGTHWSKGWVIENNTVSHSICSGIALGKHGDQFDNTSADSAEGYVKTIERAHQNSWNRYTIGHHIVRSNEISFCEQAGIVGSLGAVFSTVTDNTIHDIHVHRFFSGAEMAGIKFHAAIDTVIKNNHIYNTCLGLWLDWMAQGTRVSANLFHDNGRDLFLEVDHGPYVVDNNLFLSGANLLDISEGGAYAHNLFAGSLASAPEPSRETPYHPAHSTTVAGLKDVKGGDNRFYNNLFVGRGTAAKPEDYGLASYNPRPYPLFTGGNIYYNGAVPYGKEANPVIVKSDPKPELSKERDKFAFRINLGPELKQARTVLVTTALLGKATVPGLTYENADGSPLKIDRDFLGTKRNTDQPTAGPFEKPGAGVFTVR